MTIESKMTKMTLSQMERIVGKLTLGKLIWAIRTADDMTQVNFSKKLKISKQHLCDIERGRKSISPSLAAKYALLLGYSKEQFIRLALQDLVDREGLNVQIEVFLKRSKKRPSVVKAA